VGRKELQELWRLVKPGSKEYRREYKRTRDRLVKRIQRSGGQVALRRWHVSQVAQVAQVEQVTQVALTRQHVEVEMLACLRVKARHVTYNPSSCGTRFVPRPKYTIPDSCTQKEPEEVSNNSFLHENPAEEKETSLKNLDHVIKMELEPIDESDTKPAPKLIIERQVIIKDPVNFESAPIKEEPLDPLASKWPIERLALPSPPPKKQTQGNPGGNPKSCSCGPCLEHLAIYGRTLRKHSAATIAYEERRKRKHSAANIAYQERRTKHDEVLRDLVIKRGGLKNSKNICGTFTRSRNQQIIQYTKNLFRNINYE